MWPPAVIVHGPIPNSHVKMAFVEWNQEVETLATKAPAQSLAHRVRLGRSHGRPQNSYTQVRQTLVDFLSEDAIAIMDDEAVGMVARQRFPELLQCPFRRGMGRGVAVENRKAAVITTKKSQATMTLAWLRTNSTRWRCVPLPRLDSLRPSPE